MTLFEPVAGRSRKELVIDWVVRAKVGDTISYTRFAAGMYIDNDRAAVQAAVRAALPILEREHHRTLENVPNVGYTVADAAGHLRQGRSQRRRAGRALTRSLSKVAAVDLNTVTDEILREEILVTQRVIADQLEANRRFDAKLRRRRDRLNMLLGDK